VGRLMMRGVAAVFAIGLVALPAEATFGTQAAHAAGTTSESQEQVQQENLQSSGISNVLKTKHDTAKSAIDNIK